MGVKHHNTERKRKERGPGWRWTAVLLGFCLFLGQVNMDSMVSYAEEKGPVTIQVGENVTALLEDGRLTLSGQGGTKDFTKEDAPFTQYSADIRQLAIEEGINYIGSYLFYGLGNLCGDLTLPASITGFGTCAFSGGSADCAPSFSTIVNKAQSIQDIVSPETLFYRSRTGTYSCAAENTSFIKAALAAGYISGDAAGKDGADDAERRDGAAGQPEAAAYAAGDSVAAETTLYVSQSGGDDSTGDGTEAKPYATMDKAASVLPADGTADTNVLVLMDDYQLEQTDADKDFMKNNPRHVTIKGISKDIKIGFHIFNDNDFNTENNFINLFGNICFDSIMIHQISHIYGNGHDITVNSSVTNKGDIYLYGGGRSDINNGVGKIKVYGGSYSRIIGYVRSFAGGLDAQGTEASITVGGNASVSSIVGGLANGAVNNGNVDISIEGGRVNAVCGGNQGYQTLDASFSGRTRINVSGGKVENIYSAGSGRDQSIPNYKGSISVNVTGGEVGSLYGAGSAAYVTSGSDVTSDINMHISGNGKVKNIYGAGVGGDSTVRKSGSAEFSGKPEDFGSVTGNVDIVVGNADTSGNTGPVVDNIYASGQGYAVSGLTYETKENAYLRGSAKIILNNGTVGSIFGGGAGKTESGYENCARVAAGTDVSVHINGGVVTGDVYGGGQYAKTEASTSVNVTGGTVKGNLYGGGYQGPVEGSTAINIAGGLVEKSVYGGAKGSEDSVLVSGQSTINMTAGTVNGNIYGGSEVSDNGPEGNTDDRIFVNLVGGSIDGNVFGGGYQGIVNGSTHLHIGKDAISKCAYYSSHTGEQPSLEITADLSVGGSAYAGGDYGGEDYTAVTVAGTSHVYIDGTEYDTGQGNDRADMNIRGGVFGSGASCDAGKTRLVTLDHYGAAKKDADGNIVGATRTLTAVQRADRVVVHKSHVELSGQSDVANVNQTAKYSLNRIGNHGNSSVLGALGNSLVLQEGSTLILDSDVLEVANLRSIDASGTVVDTDGLTASPNTISFSSGTVFRLSYTDLDTDKETYGGVYGHAYMAVADTSVAYAYARSKTGEGENDGGFVSLKDNKELAYTDVNGMYRYWKISGSAASAARNTVLTAIELKNGEAGYGADGYSSVAGIIELPPAEKGSDYTIKSITLPGGVSLVDAAKDKADGGRWLTTESNTTAGSEVDLAGQKKKIDENPLSAFGLYMGFGDGFPAGTGKVISNESAQQGGTNNIIGQTVTYEGEDIIPRITFCLTYANDKITASQNLGDVEVTMSRSVNGKEEETTTMKVEIVTKAGGLSEQTINLYAAQSGSYTGNLIIPSGTSRNLSLADVQTGEAGELVQAESTLGGCKYSITMQPVQSGGWNSSGLMKDAFDLAAYMSGASIPIGVTDSRYEASVAFSIKNSPKFTAKTLDVITLTLHDSSNNTDIKVTLNIHWNASIVKHVKISQGKQYNSTAADASAAIARNSAVTASYELEFAGTEQAARIWLEMQDPNGIKVDIPEGTKITLKKRSSFYVYETDGGKKDRVMLSEFTEMWKTGGPGNVNSGDTLTVIVDFSASGGLADGGYSLRLKNETGADSSGAAFTVGSSEAAVSFSKTGETGLSRGEHHFMLCVEAGYDTRYNDGAAAMISQPGGRFPEGTVFKCGGRTYHPIGGYVYVPLALSEDGCCEIVMDTGSSDGLAPGNYTLTANVFPAGLQAGGAVPSAIEKTAEYTVSANPEYGIAVALSDGQDRSVEAGQTVEFDVQYAVTGVAGASVEVSLQKKNGGTYESVPTWEASGNESAAGSGMQKIRVKIPEGVSGTYRLNFKLGDETAPYNVIVY